MPEPHMDTPPVRAEVLPGAERALTLTSSLGICADFLQPHSGLGSMQELEQFQERLKPALQTIEDEGMRQRVSDTLLVGKVIQLGIARTRGYAESDKLFDLPNNSLSRANAEKIHSTPEALYTSVLFLLRGQTGGDIPNDPHQKVKWGYAGDLLKRLPPHHAAEVVKLAAGYYGFRENAVFGGTAPRDMSLVDVVSDVAAAMETQKPVRYAQADVKPSGVREAKPETTKPEQAKIEEPKPPQALLSTTSAEGSDNDMYWRGELHRGNLVKGFGHEPKPRKMLETLLYGKGNALPPSVTKKY